TFAIGMAGAKNEELFAASILQHTDINIAKALDEFRAEQTRFVLENPDPREH
ncbi:5-(carboxyamino)imidazole ribonucleotide mutase, partial [Francisella tularensis subsp. holarctica]|nr:5-(carboxyamino)imidazole ribonucleotide mutase [Francisella tularensis subsp. holarctica]